MPLQKPRALCLAHSLCCSLFLLASLNVSAASQIVQGEIKGAPYQIEIPETWNGDLVMLQHGFVFPGPGLTLPPADHAYFDPLSTELAARGYAVAYSAFRTNGWAIQEGAKDTSALAKHFDEAFGPAENTYLIGYSMGTQIGDMLVRKGPQKDRFAGHLAVCASLGGATLLTNYSNDGWVLFDYFFPGVLPGEPITTGFDFFGIWFSEILPAIQANPVAATEYASVMGIPWNSPPERDFAVLLSLIIIGDGMLGIQDSAKGNFFDNQFTVYSGSSDDMALNEGVARYEADPRAQEYLRRYYDPTGSLGHTRVLHLHETRDPIVNLQLHVSAYHQVLEAAGESGQYVLRTKDQSNHCGFSNDEILASFDDLVEWVETGVAPTP